MPNFFSDPELRARQDVLNAQWNGLWGTYNATCSNGLGNAFPEFATDKRNWDDFYGSESDWSSASKHATDEWQTKAQEWAKRLKDYGCGDNQYSDLGIPGVKDNPEDRPGVLDALETGVKTYVAGVGVVVLLVLAAALAAIYFLSKSKVGVNV
jgi:hypothetical protein